MAARLTPRPRPRARPGGLALAAGLLASLCVAAGGTVATRAPSGTLRPPALEDVEQMCALLTSCEQLPLPNGLLPVDMGKCVRNLQAELSQPSGVAFSLTIRECGLAANTCGELRTCALRGAKADACVGRGQQAVAGYCDADGRALSCFHDRVITVRDCPRGGEQCVVRGGEAQCALGPCPPDIPEGGPPVCSASGTRILKCERGRLVSLDCAAFGLKCVRDGGQAACAPDTAACTAGSATCDGSIAVGCHHGREVRVECAAGGLECKQPAASAVGICSMPAAEAAACDASAPTRCEGATLKYCVAGRARSYPCKAVGFTRCVSDAKGARCAS